MTDASLLFSALRVGGATHPSRTLPLVDLFLHVTSLFKILRTLLTTDLWVQFSREKKNPVLKNPSWNQRLIWRVFFPVTITIKRMLYEPFCSTRGCVWNFFFFAEIPYTHQVIYSLRIRSSEWTRTWCFTFLEALHVLAHIHASFCENIPHTKLKLWIRMLKSNASDPVQLYHTPFTLGTYRHIIQVKQHYSIKTKGQLPWQARMKN